MKIWKWFWDWWYWRLRRIDMKFLWPSCRRISPNIDQARAAFMVHAFNDPAWMWLGELKIIMFIDKLE
jgi:hypothetical protein